MKVKSLNLIGVGALLTFSFSTILGFILISVIVANTAFRNIDQSEAELSDTSIPTLVNVNRLSTVALNLIQASSYMADSIDKEELKKRKITVDKLTEELKHYLNNLKKLNLSVEQVYKIELILNKLEKNTSEVYLLLNSLLEIDAIYKNKVLNLEELTFVISDHVSILKVNANSALLNKIQSKQNNINYSNTIHSQESAYDQIKEELRYKDTVSEIFSRNSELHRSLQVIDETDTKESILAVEQDFDHALRVITRATVNSDSDEVRSLIGPHLSVLIKHGQDHPDIFDLRIKLLQAKNDIDLINRENIIFAQNLNSSINTLADVVKGNTDSASSSLQRILETSKIKLYTITVSAIIAGILLTLFTIRHITRPLKKLVQATKEIGRGNLDYEIEVVSEDELGELANSFNLMTSNLKKSNHQIQFLAYHDALTGLPNRRMFNEFAKKALIEANRNNDILAVLFIDLDNFKKVNDTLGHDVGDELLKSISDRITENIRASDCMTLQNSKVADNFLARIGGDEFILLLKCLNDSLEPGVIATRLLKILDEPFSIRGESIYMNASIGIAICPDDANNINDLLKYADIAMYAAKEKGKGMYHYYSDSMNTAIFKVITLEKKLHKAISNNELILHYQPIVDTKTHGIVGVEALVRWQDPELGLIPPDSFISIAEGNGLILPIGEWVIQEACKQANNWNEQFDLNLSVSVNVSSVQFMKQDLYKVVSNTLKSNNFKPELLHIEITESLIMHSSGEILNTFDKLKSLNINISLDDFGTGYSSLNYLRKYPIDILKIDRQFTSEITEENLAPPLVTAIINMAHGLNLKVIAEGVEDQLQCMQLRNLKCDQLQGYFFSQPVSVNQMTELIRASMIKSA